MATIHVGMGSSSREWLIPATILSRRSVFFKNALKEWSKEGQDQLVTLADDDPDIFSLYLNALYYESLTLKSLPCIPPDDDEHQTAVCHDEDLIAVDHTTLCHLFVLAEYL